jgi:acyl-CoA thioester hydrolase
MSRLVIDTPLKYAFHTLIRVRVDDLNYGNHLSNDCYLKYMHEARMQYLKQIGLTEMNIGGCGIIMGDTAIRFQQECFYNDLLKIEVAAAHFGKRSFDFFYGLRKRLMVQPFAKRKPEWFALIIKPAKRLIFRIHLYSWPGRKSDANLGTHTRSTFHCDGAVIGLYIFLA